MTRLRTSIMVCCTMYWVHLNVVVAQAFSCMEGTQVDGRRMQVHLAMHREGYHAVPQGYSLERWPNPNLLCPNIFRLPTPVASQV